MKLNVTDWPIRWKLLAAFFILSSIFIGVSLTNFYLDGQRRAARAESQAWHDIAEEAAELRTAFLEDDSSMTTYVYQAVYDEIDFEPEDFIGLHRERVAYMQHRILAIRDAIGSRSMGHEYQFLVDATQRLETDLKAYEAATSTFISANKSKGFFNEGLEGKFRDNAHNLESLVEGDPTCLSELLQMRRREKDYILREELIDSIEIAANRGAELVKQVLSFARGEEGSFLKLQLHHVVSETIRIAENTFPEQIRFEVDLPSNLRSIEGDATKIQQVLMNLLVNARDAMPDGGVICMTGKNVFIEEGDARLIPEGKPGHYICLSVSDTGTGISEATQEKIFDPFFTTKDLGKGTGLGLSTVASVVKGHGGLLFVTSEEGVGTTFEIYFPNDQVESETEGSDNAPARGNGEGILLVDDERGILEMMRRTLENFGYKAYVAGDGAQAVAAYNSNADDISMVITDAMMPFVSGQALIAVLQKLNPNLPIILISGLEDRLDTIDDSIVAAKLLKPVAPQALLRSISEILQSGTTESENY